MEATATAVSDGILDEGHIEAIFGVTSDVASLAPWLTTEQAQTELTAEVLLHPPPHGGADCNRLHRNSLY